MNRLSILSRLNKLSKTILLIGVMLASFTTRAELIVTTSMPSTLADTMKSMSSNLKKIAAQAADPAQNAASEKLSQDLVMLTENSKLFIPDKIKNLPADQLEVRKAEYLKMIEETLVLENNLSAAFHNNDNKSAQEILTLLSTIKKDGHTEFKNK